MKIVELTRNNCHLSVDKGFLCIRSKGGEIGREILADIETVIVGGFGITYSHTLLQRLCLHNIPLIICGANFQPAGCLLAHSANYLQTERIYQQIDASLPLKKQLWQRIIKHKIEKQRQVLVKTGDAAKDFAMLVSRVKSGDSDNTEAYAARLYWKRLFGNAFVRDYEQPGINSFLNFGYAIIRSCFARNIVASGLAPALGIFHHNMRNPYCLADDLMEPYRPFVDYCVYGMHPADAETLTPAHKRAIGQLLSTVVTCNNEQVSLQHAVQITVRSLVRSYQDKKNELHFPKAIV